MSSTIKKMITYTLTGLILIITIIAILQIWEIINLDIEDIFNKVLLSFFAIFGASLVLLFIFSVVVKDNQTPKDNKDK